MADILRSVPWRSAELAGDPDVADFADDRLLHPHLFGALRRVSIITPLRNCFPFMSARRNIRADFGRPAPSARSAINLSKPSHLFSFSASGRISPMVIRRKHKAESWPLS